MICKNCGKEFEGKFCPHCGHDSSKPTKAETAEKRKAAAGKLKEKLKPATDFVKKHKLLVIIVAAVLVAAIIVGTTLGVVLSNDFRVGKMNQITIGMTKAEVKEKLGEPHEDEASTWYYYSKNYKKLIDEAKKLTSDGEDTGEEDMSEEDFESALGDLDSTLKKLEELEAKAAALLHDEIRISFSDDKVTAVEMLKNISEETKDAKKEVKKAKLGVEEVQRFTTLKTPVYAIVEYTDGSYRNAPVVLKEQPNTENEGKTQVTWHDLWSDTDVTAEINVVKNPNIYKQGQLNSSTEYFIFKTNEGYTLSFLGNGAISANNNEYPWEDIKDKITKVNISSGVTSIDSFAFSGCDGLETITVAEGNTKYKSAGNCIIETATKTLIAGCKASVIPTDGSVTSIGYQAFYGCSSLTSIAIPDSVTSIGYSAFSGCSSLRELKMPAEVAGVYGANNVTKVVITGGTSIGSSAFLGCSRLTSITIGNGVTSIGYSAFYGCRSLTNIAIPNSVTSIGHQAFAFCSSLTSITIPDSVTSIGSEAFRGCSSLTINAEAEAKPSGWDSSWTYSPVVWNYKNNDVADDGYIYTIQNGIRYGIKDGAAVVVRQPSNITEANIASEIVYKETRYSVTGIGNDAFYGCSSLTSIVIGNGVTSISSDAFKGTGIWNNAAENSVVYADKWAVGYKGTLSEVTLKADTVGIGSKAFYECRSLTSIAIPDSVTSIGNSAFSWCSNLTNIAIPDSVTSIGYFAFSGCISLTSIAIPDSVTSIGNYAFHDCSSLTSITIGNSVTSIGNSAFYGCSSLTSIAIGNSVTSIGNSAFYRCSSLTSITIPNSVTSIGYDAFLGCSRLTSITIGNGVTSIGDSAFQGCSSLTSITYQGTKAEWKAITKGSYWNSITGEYTVTCTDGTL